MDNELLQYVLEDIQFMDIIDDSIILNEMAYEDYCDHFYARLKSLAYEYNKNDKIFKRLSKILNIDVKNLPKFECHIRNSGFKQLSYTMINQDIDLKIRAGYERYLNEMIITLKKELNDYPGVSNIWTADGECIIYINLDNLEEGQLIESAIKYVNDKGEDVPKICPKCESNVGVFLRDEPVFLCTNKKCGKFFGVVPCDL